MPAMAIPLAPEKLDAWEAWTAELSGPKAAEFADMNSRHGLDEHRAYLQPLPDGGFLVLVVAEGDGADGFLDSIGASDHEFDQWFIGSVADLHQADPDEERPPMAQRKL
ncbi:MAG: hypothetical protein JST53_14610 [Actinobacteria bacterium]|nr:hypothetical protein [Actinomycetota bacterium]